MVTNCYQLCRTVGHFVAFNITTTKTSRRSESVKQLFRCSDAWFYITADRSFYRTNIPVTEFNCFESFT